MSSDIYGKRLEIDINSKGIFIESRKINDQIPYANLKGILGEPSRKGLGLNEAWFYDDLGVIARFHPETDYLSSLSLIRSSKSKSSKAVKKHILGDMFIYDYKIDLYVTPPVLKKIPELKFQDLSMDSYSNNESLKASNDHYTLRFEFGEEYGQKHALLSVDIEIKDNYK